MFFAELRGGNGRATVFGRHGCIGSVGDLQAAIGTGCFGGGGAVPSRPTKKVHKNLLAVMTVILDESFLVGVVFKHLYLTMNKMAYFRPLANKQQRSQNYHLFTCHLFSSLPGVSSLLPSPPSKLCHWRNREGRNAQ